MQSSNESRFVETDLTVSDFFRQLTLWGRYLLTQWWKILAGAVIGGVIGALIAFSSPKTYSSNLSFILEESKGGASSLSAISSELGLDLGGGFGGSSSMLSGENIIGLLKSRRFIKEVLVSSYSGNYSLADKYVDIHGLRSDLLESSGGDIRIPSNETRLNRRQDSLLHTIQDRIVREELSVVRPEKRMSFFQVNLASRDELFSKLFTERLVDKTIGFYIEAKTRRLRTNVDRLQRRADSIGALLNNKTFSAAVAQSQALDINPAYQTATVRAELNTRDKMLLATIYGELVKNLEVQKVVLSQETPVIEIIDAAELPLKTEKLSIALYFVLGGMLFTFIAIAILVSRRLYIKNIKSTTIK